MKRGEKVNGNVSLVKKNALYAHKGGKETFSLIKRITGVYAFRIRTYRGLTSIFIMEHKLKKIIKKKQQQP